MKVREQSLHLSVRLAVLPGSKSHQPEARRVARAGCACWTDRRKRVRFCFCTLLEAAPISTNDKRTRVNRQIRISPVRVIGAEGEQLGILPVEEALAQAEAQGLDLVEVAATARPPV